MKVPHLNEFLRRALEEGVLSSISVVFPKEGYYTSMGFEPLRVSPLDGMEWSVRLTGKSASDRHSWGISEQSSSMEIRRIKLLTGIAGRGTVLVELGKKCSRSGVL
jgi:hypothetical protein